MIRKPLAETLPEIDARCIAPWGDSHIGGPVVPVSADQLGTTSLLAPNQA